MSNTLYGDRRFRTPNVLDEDVREGLAIEMDTLLSVERVIRLVEQVVSWRGQPQAIRFDKGPEFIAEQFITWCAERAHVHAANLIRMLFSRIVSEPDILDATSPILGTPWTIRARRLTSRT